MLVFLTCKKSMNRLLTYFFDEGTVSTKLPSRSRSLYSCGKQSFEKISAVTAEKVLLGEKNSTQNIMVVLCHRGRP